MIEQKCHTTSGALQISDHMVISERDQRGGRAKSRDLGGTSQPVETHGPQNVAAIDSLCLPHPH